MIAIEQYFVPIHLISRVSYDGINQEETLTVHQTDNFNDGANAEAHAKLQALGNRRKASWHYQSDDEKIIQSFKHSVQTFHAGDGRGNGNLHSISWEICVNKDGDYRKTLEVASKGIAQTLKKMGKTTSALRQHYDWSKKNCPSQIRKCREGVCWSDFVDMVKKEMNEKIVDVPNYVKKDGHLNKQQVVNKTINGGYGTQPDRENNIRKHTNFTYEEIQPLVNQLLTGNKTKVTGFNEVVNQTIDGEFGTGAERRRRIPIETVYNYQEVQDEVNKRLLGKSLSKNVNIGDKVKTNALYANSQSSKNVRQRPITGVVDTINKNWRNEIRLRNKKEGYYIGFTRKQDLV